MYEVDWVYLCGDMVDLSSWQVCAMNVSSLDAFIHFTCILSQTLGPYLLLFSLRHFNHFFERNFGR